MPADLEKAIETVINASPQFGYGMYFVVELCEEVETTRTVKGKKQHWKRTEIATTVYKKAVSHIQTMLDDIEAILQRYGLELDDVCGFRLELVDLL